MTGTKAMIECCKSEGITKVIEYQGVDIASCDEGMYT